MKNLILSLVIAIVSSVNVFGQTNGYIQYSDFTTVDFTYNGIGLALGDTVVVDIDNLYKDTLSVRYFNSVEVGNTINNTTCILEQNGNVLTFKTGPNNTTFVTWIITFTQGHVLSIGNQVEVDNLTLYPNPVQDVLNIRFDSYENVDVIVTDLNGRVVYNENVSGFTSVDLSNQPAGIYFVNVGSTTRKVVKQ